MALTTLDPNTALIVVDLQKGIVGPPRSQPVDDVITQAQALARAFRARALRWCSSTSPAVRRAAPSSRAPQWLFLMDGPTSFPSWGDSPATSW